MPGIRILLADDHRLFRQGLRQLLELENDFAVVGEAADGQQAVELAARLGPDVVLMDISMPILDGVKAAGKILDVSPKINVIILTMYRQDQYVLEAIKAGAKGYLLKDIDEQKLTGAIRRVSKGEVIFDPGMALMLLEEFKRIRYNPEPDYQKLTKGEMTVLKQVARGEDNRRIAQALDISESTVANRLSEIYHKLQVDNRTQAALFALRQGWAKIDL